MSPNVAHGAHQFAVFVVALLLLTLGSVVERGGEVAAAPAAAAAAVVPGDAGVVGRPEEEEEEGKKQRLTVPVLIPLPDYFFGEEGPQEDRGEEGANYPTGKWPEERQKRDATLVGGGGGGERGGDVTADYVPFLRKKGFPSGGGRRSSKWSREWRRLRGRGRRQWPKRNLYKNSRFGKKRKRIGFLDKMGLGGIDGSLTTEEKLQQISGAIAVWEAKLMKFAEKFSDAPGVLNENPTWIRLLQVRDTLKQMLAKAELQALDQTRM